MRCRLAGAACQFVPVLGTSLRRLAPGNSVGVNEHARLIGRIKHGEFGVLVTTSYVNEQAYREASSGSERWSRRQDQQNDAKDQDDSATVMTARRAARCAAIRSRAGGLLSGLRSWPGGLRSA